MITNTTAPAISPEITTVNADNPWPGLLPYHEVDQRFFYGREKESLELHRLVMREPLTILFGLSGLGKSSLLQAGLFPRLRQQNIFPVYIRLGFSADLPGLREQVKQAISLEAAAVNIQTPGENEGETLWEYFHRRNADFWNERNRLMLPILVFDQFEEVFTLGRLYGDRPNDTEVFLNELGDLIEGRPPSILKEHLDDHPDDANQFDFNRHYYKVLLCLREDFLADLEGLRERMPSVIHNRMRLRHMNGIAALEVVAHAKQLIEPQVAELVVRFVAAAGDADLALEKLELEPALLSVVCRELNLKRQQHHESRITGNLLEGSQQEILSGFYESSISDLPPEVRAFVEERLLTVSGYRDSVAFENAINTSGITTEDLNLLMQRRLIRKEDRGGIQRLELTHDLLTGVIAASRDRRRQREAEERRAKELSDRQRQQRLEDRAKTARRFLWLSAALTMLFFVALYAFYKAGQQSQQAEQEKESAVKEKEEAKKERLMADSQRKRAELQGAIAENQRKQAEAERALADSLRKLASKAEKVATQRLEIIRANVRLRQVISSRDATAIQEAYKTTTVERQIKFRATEKVYPYNCKNGSPQKRYQMFPVEQSIPGGFNSIALITYIMDHPSFASPLLSAGPDTQFKGTYDGCACLSQVTAVIEYTDVDKPLSIAKFDMCDILEKVK